jgi:hypothetical protein
MPRLINRCPPACSPSVMFPRFGPVGGLAMSIILSGNLAGSAGPRLGTAQRVAGVPPGRSGSRKVRWGALGLGNGSRAWVRPHPAADELPRRGVVSRRRARPAAVRPLSHGASCPDEPPIKANQSQTRRTASCFTPIHRMVHSRATNGQTSKNAPHGA